MKRVAFVLLTLAVGLSSAAHDSLLLRQDFDTSWSSSMPPSGWRISYTGADAWTRGTGAPWSANPTPYAMKAWTSSGDQTDTLLSPVFDCSNVRNIVLRCSTFFRPLNITSYTAKLIYTRDNGLNWETVRDYSNDSFGPGREVFSVDTLGLVSAARFAWVWSGNLIDIYNWCLDNVSVVGTVASDTDLAPIQVVRPYRLERRNSTFVPSVTVANLGRTAQSDATVYAWARRELVIYGPYSRVISTLAPGERTTLTFDNFTLADSNAVDTMYFASTLAGDQDPGNDTLVQVFDVSNTDYFHYDNDSATGREHWSTGGNSGWGLKVTPIFYPAVISVSEFHLNGPADARYRIRVVADDGPGDSPGTEIYESPAITLHTLSGWNSDALGALSLTINDGGFYLFYVQEGDWPECAELSHDARRSPDASYWQLDAGIYSRDSDTTNGDWMIRCLLDYNPPPAVNYDARTVYVTAPEDEITLRPVGASFVPEARIENHGLQTLIDFPVACSIDATPAYSSLRLIDSLTPGQSYIAVFDTWTPGVAETVQVTVRTMYSGDENTANDAASKVVKVYRPLYTSRPEIPDRYAWIDSDTLGGPVYDWIDSRYAYTAINADIDMVQPVDLNWLFKYRGASYSRVWVCNNGWLSFSSMDSVKSSNDSIPKPATPNNALYPFWDHLRAGAGGMPVSRVWYKTVGYEPERKFVIGWDSLRFYDGPGASDYLSFQVILEEVTSNITYQYRHVRAGLGGHDFGRHATVGIENADGSVGSQYLYGNGGVRGNWPANKLLDERAITFFQTRTDVGATRFVEPHPYLIPGLVTPKIKLKNFGNYMQPFYAILRIDSINGHAAWRDSIRVDFMPMNTESLFTFPSWTATFGSWIIKCSTAMISDANNANNAIIDTFTVQAWIERAGIPRGRYNKAVRNGALAYLAPYIYAFKGASTNEFWRYDLAKDSWDSLPGIPAGYRNRKTKEGCALTAANGMIYATKGGRTREFFTYNPSTGSWNVRESIPWGASNKQPFNGTCMTYNPATNLIYLLKGSGSNEFYDYNLVLDDWTARRGPVIFGGKIRVTRGTSISAAHDSLLYVPNPSNIYGFIKYNLRDTTWRQMSVIPAGPRNRKVRAGSGSAVVNDTLFVTKGGNTTEIWGYSLSQPPGEIDRWQQRMDIPEGTYRKRIKTGGAMTTTGDMIFVFKGGNTTEFWMYGPSFDTIHGGGRDQGPGAQAEDGFIPGIAFACRAEPNPSVGPMAIRLAVPRSINARIRVFDITGKLVSTLFEGGLSAGRQSLDWGRIDNHGRAVANGVYLLRFESADYQATQKLILQ